MHLTFFVVLIAASVAAPSIGEGGDTRDGGQGRKQLVMIGTVTSIKQTGAVDSLKPWAVTVRIDKVVSGELLGDTFTFVVHSPARAGLERRASYTIRAVWNGTGYSVDENQWRKDKGSRRKSAELANQALQSDELLRRFAPSAVRR
jgi:hypothetical protein